MNRTLLGALLALLWLAGCGPGGGAPTPADPALARQTLAAALDAWKAGEPHDAPAKRPEPIRVADEDWLAGARLVDFQIGDPEPLSGPRLRLPATLKLKDPRGKAVERRVVYLVALEPGRMVIRQD
jgi:hypothetical protein